MRKNIAVFGARGFIGKNTVFHLQKNSNYRVVPVTREVVDLLDGSAVKRFFEKERIDIAVHCANKGGTRKDRNSEIDVVGNNLKMFFNIERCIEPGMKMINFGSGAQYDKARDLRKVKEDEFDENVPKDAYGYSKYVMSKFIKEYNKKEGRGQIYNLIVFGMYGIGEDYTYRFISNAIIKNLLGLPIIINQNVRFDYLFVEDYFKILDLLLDGDWIIRECNVTPTESVSLLEIAEIINEIGEYKSEIIIKNEGMNYEYTGDNGLLLGEIGYDFKFTGYSEGIRNMYRYYARHLDTIDVSKVEQDNLLQFCNKKG